MTQEPSFYIDVILPIPIRQLFTYGVNKDEAAFLKPGMRVAVPFGKKKLYTALVYTVHTQAPSHYETKEIDHILDQKPLVPGIEIKFWEWLSSYYCCPLGEVMRASLLKAFLLESETLVFLNQATNFDKSSLNDAEYLVYEALQLQTSLHIKEVSLLLDIKNVLPIIHGLVAKKVVFVQEEIFEQYSPKLVKYVKLHQDYSSEKALNGLLNSLSKAPKQKEVLLAYFSLSAQGKKVKSRSLQKECETSSSILKALISKGIFEDYTLQTDRVVYSGEAPQPLMALNKYQEVAFASIKQSFLSKEVCLLHGVTSSGKTEIYVKLISEALEKGKQVLYMLPEIALTVQLIKRLQNYFGKKVSVYHSRYAVNERVEVWQNVLQNNNKAQIVIGARSAMFLPFSNLGLVVVDEEHEVSFKQYNPSPRYHARDASIVLAKMHNAKVLLGSATPSVESYNNAKKGKYGLVNLKQRYGEILMPEIELIDLKEKYKRKLMKGHFSDRLLSEIQAALDCNEQVILFQNRRGYSPIVQCTTCSISPQCPNCDVSLTFHQFKNQLRCHYCGYNMAMTTHCRACESGHLSSKGFGTEQIELELKELFPNSNIARMDQDTTRGKYAQTKLIEAFENEEIDILVGTQMLAKGLDFRNVTLVGIMNADNLLNFPDFRAHERCFQLLQQVSGRAGRTKKRGLVLIQTYNPYHQILQQVSVNDYEAMFKNELSERYNYKYPPFYKLIRIKVKHKNFQKMHQASLWFAEALRITFKSHVLGPEQPLIGRIRNEYISHILLKIPKEQSILKSKAVLLKVEKHFSAIKEYSAVKISVDVDNY